MDFDPEEYEKTGFDAILPAKELIKQIKTINANKEKIPIVLDIGCGPGNTAKMLAKELNPERIVGVDIDQQMIEFAKESNPMPNTEYYCQDISAEWSELDENLRKLCGKVSVIFSNYALHWIKEVERTAHNMAKLLTPNGQIVVDILYVGDIFHRLRPELRTEYEQWLQFPNEQQVVGRWITAFKSAGLTHIELKYWKPKCIYPQKIYFDDFIKWPINWYKSFIRADAKPDVDVDELLKDLIIKKRVRRMTEKSIQGEELIEITQELWNFVVTR